MAFAQVTDEEIARLYAKPSPFENIPKERWIADWPPSDRWPHYTRSNAGEVLATPASPLGQQFTFDNGMSLPLRAMMPVRVMIRRLVKTYCVVSQDR